MFEKEAEEYASHGGLPKEKHFFGVKAIAFKEGAEFGYSKGNKDKNEARRLLTRWLDDGPYTVSELKDLIADTEQFLKGDI